MSSAVVADDEVNLLDHLVRVLADVWPELKIVGTATDGDRALALIESRRPDVAFLDIRMPGLSGLQVAQQVAATTQVVFVSAYEEFAIDAFEKAAVDYVLKPVTAARVKKTVERLQNVENTARAQLPQLMFDELLGKLSSNQPDAWVQWLRSGSDTQTQLVSVSDVVYITAESKYTTIYTADGEFLVRKSINELSETLDPNQFWRIHRSTIVKVSEIKEARRDIRGRYTLTLKSLSAKLRSSQRYGHLFKLS